MADDDEAPRHVRLIGLGPQLAALLAALLPAIGAGVRVVAFTLGFGASGSLEVSLAVPVSVLAGIGLLNMLVPLIFCLIVLAAFHMARPASFLRERRSSAVMRTISRAALVLFSLSTALILPGFPAGILAMAGGLSTGLFTGLRERRGVVSTFGNTWPFVVWVAAIGITVGALNGTTLGVSTARFAFESEVGLPDGTYVRLAQNDGLTYVRPCRGTDRRVVVVRSDDVLSARLNRRPREIGPSLLEILRGREKLRLGARYACPKA